MLEIYPIVICCFAVFSGGMLQGCLGFGFAFIALPVFAMFMPPTLSTPLIVSLSLVLNSLVTVSCFRHIDKKVIVWLLTGGVIGIPIGGRILQHVDASVYSLLVGILIMGAAGMFLFDKRYPFKNRMSNYLPSGFASGVLNASLGMSGPPVILFMNNQGVEKEVMRATMVGYFLMINTFSILWFVYNRLIAENVFFLLQYFAPAVIAGTFIGIFISRFIDEQRFRRIVLLCVMLIGLAVSVKSFLW